MRKVHYIGKPFEDTPHGLCGQYIAPAYSTTENIEEVTCLKCKKLLDKNRPTVEQVAWVFEKLRQHGGEGTFRYLIYDLMGFSPKDYYLLHKSGGMYITNSLFVANEKGGYLL